MFYDVDTRSTFQDNIDTLLETFFLRKKHNSTTVICCLIKSKTKYPQKQILPVFLCYKDFNEIKKCKSIKQLWKEKKPVSH